MNVESVTREVIAEVIAEALELDDQLEVNALISEGKVFVMHREGGPEFRIIVEKM